MQSFLGFANFYCHFITNFLHHVQPLFDLMKKDAPFAWKEEEEAVFAKLKEIVTSAPILILPQVDRPFHISRWLWGRDQCSTMPGVTGRRQMAPGRFPIQNPQ
jgi:hypothetical protein